MGGMIGDTVTISTNVPSTQSVIDSIINKIKTPQVNVENVSLSQEAINKIMPYIVIGIIILLLIFMKK